MRATIPTRWRLIRKTVAFVMGRVRPPRHLPRSRQNPKILGRDDTEVIRYLITVCAPSSGHLLAQEGQDHSSEISERRMTSIVRDMLVHQAPEPLDRIQLRA